MLYLVVDGQKLSWFDDEDEAQDAVGTSQKAAVDRIGKTFTYGHFTYKNRYVSEFAYLLKVPTIMEEMVGAYSMQFLVITKEGRMRCKQPESFTYFHPTLEDAVSDAWDDGNGDEFKIFPVLDHFVD